MNVKWKEVRWIKKLIKPKKYCEDNVEFYSGEVQPVSGTSSVNPTPGPTPVPSMPGSAGTSNGNGTSPFLELLLSLLGGED